MGFSRSNSPWSPFAKPATSAAHLKAAVLNQHCENYGNTRRQLCLEKHASRKDFQSSIIWDSFSAFIRPGVVFFSNLVSLLS